MSVKEALLLTAPRVGRVLALGLFVYCLMSWLLWTGQRPAMAQTPEPIWTEQLNLSRSGAAQNVQMALDASGRLHVLWQDSVRQAFIYMRNVGGNWQEPQTVELPFGARSLYPELDDDAETPLFMPLLVGDTAGFIHAFWIDDERVLHYARVEADNFGELAAWEISQSLAEGVLDLDVSLDATDTLHLSYVRTAATTEEPAGVYYRQSDNRGTEWSPSILLYESDYFGTLMEETAHVQIAASPDGQVFVALDNRPLEKVFVVRSANGGLGWDAPQEVDGRQATDSNEAAGPARVMLSANSNNILLMWQAAHDGLSCALHYTWSLDGGLGWQPTQRLDTLQECPEHSQLIETTQDITLLMTNSPGKANLIAWDGQNWGLPQQQDTLSTFLNPETYQPVTLSCLQAVLDENRLYVIGCNAGGGGDIWLTSRQIESLAEWFPPPPEWNSPEVITMREEGIASPALSSDETGRLHAVWRLPDQSAIYHSVWDGASWYQPRAVFNSPTALVSEPGIILTNLGDLLVSWADALPGQIFLIRARADQALVASDWSLPHPLPPQYTVVAGPEMVAENTGRIYLSYAVSVNEGRGVYLTWSDDYGESWSEPVKAFDGVSAGWVMVGRPRLSLTEDGRIHILLTQHSTTDSEGPAALSYIHSTDGGRSWSEAKQVAEAPVTWSAIAGGNEGTVHVIWEEREASRTVLWHILSRDGGFTWSLPVTISSLDNVGSADIMLGSTGRLHLLYGTSTTIQHWLWNGERWSQGENLALTGLDSLTDLATALLPDGRLALIYIGQITDAETKVQIDTLFFASRPLEDPATSQPPAIPIVTAAPSPTEMPTPMPTTTTVSPNVMENEVESPPGEERGLVSGILPAGLIVLVGFGLGIRALRGGRR